MYSRSMGRSPYATSKLREPSYRRELRVPPNYSGTAIGSPPPDGVSPATDGMILQEPSPPVEVTGGAEERKTEETALQTEAPTVSSETPPARPSSSPLSGLLSGQGFPFGHGLGFEELLLLGLILFLLREGEGTGEESDLSVTLLLLGALLFCG